LFALWSKYLGTSGASVTGRMIAAAPNELPGWLAGIFAAQRGTEPPQNLREYDPEWGPRLLDRRGRGEL